MSERADLRLPCEHGRYEEHPPPLSMDTMLHKAMCPGGRSLTPAEALAVLLPNVDWEALRGELSDREIAISENPWLETRTEKVVRRLLAVYDGKDG